MAETEFSVKCEILADLWLNHREEEEWGDFIEYNDLGLPLSYAISNGIVESTSMAEMFIGETYNLLLEYLGVEDDAGFDSLEDVLEAS